MYVAPLPAEIRSNVQVTAEDGAVVSPMLTRAYLFEWIETLSWREIAVHDLLRSGG